MGCSKWTFPLYAAKAGCAGRERPAAAALQALGRKLAESRRVTRNRQNWLRQRNTSIFANQKSPGHLATYHILSSSQTLIRL